MHFRQNYIIIFVIVLAMEFLCSHSQLPILSKLSKMKKNAKLTIASAKFLRDFIQRNSQELLNKTPKHLGTYDFIVIGAGSAGSVVASRLSDNKMNKVLLLEEGGPENLLMDIPIMALFQTYFGDIFWNYYTEPSNDYCRSREGSRCHLPMGKVMGGSSVMNFMIATRGNKKDFDDWASMTGDSSWSYEKMLPYFKKLETNNVKLAPIADDYHNFDGPVNIVNPSNRTLLADAFVQAGEEMGYSALDYNGHKQTGFSYIQANQVKGERMSTNRAYLHPARNRTNLVVSMYSRVVKILINPQTKKAYGVLFVKHNLGSSPKVTKVFASKEIILSAGAISSSQLLMLSGIGPEKHLREHKIEVLKNAPVGKNFIDHVVYAGLTFLVNGEVGVNMDSLLDFQQNPAMSDWLLRREGPYTIIGSIEGIGYVNFSKPQTDPPDVELLFTSSHLGINPFLRKPFKFSKEHYDHSFGKYAGKNGWMIWPLVLQPKSRGRIFLRSANPYDTPKIIPRYWSHPDDIKLTIKGIKMSIELSKTKSMQKYDSTLVDTGVLGCEEYVWGSDDYWECAIRAHTVTLWHYAGTCKMGSENDSTAVVNSRLQVIGIKRLRVVDGGVMPMVPRAHTNIPIIALAEKAAEMIKDNWRYTTDYNADTSDSDREKDSESSNEPTMETITDPLIVPYLDSSKRPTKAPTVNPYPPYPLPPYAGPPLGPLMVPHGYFHPKPLKVANISPYPKPFLGTFGPLPSKPPMGHKIDPPRRRAALRPRIRSTLFRRHFPMQLERYPTCTVG